MVLHMCVWCCRSLSSSQVDSKEVEDDDNQLKDEAQKGERLGRKQLQEQQQQQQLKVNQPPRSADSSPTRYERSQTINTALQSIPAQPTARGQWMNTSGSPRPPSYASGSRSAQSSRSASPDKHHSRTSFSPVRKITNYPDPPPSFLISPPHQGQSRQPVDSQSSTDMTEVFSRLARPQQLTKSISMDSAPLTSFTSGYSAPVPSNQATGPGARAENNRGMMCSLAPGTTGSLDRLSPRTARKKFFAEDTSSTTSSTDGFSQWRIAPQALVTEHSKVNQTTNAEAAIPAGYSSLPDRRGQAFAQQAHDAYLFPFGMDSDPDTVPAMDPHQLEMLYYPAHGAVARNLPPLETPPKPPMTWDEKVNLVDNTGLDAREKSKTIGAPSSQFLSFHSSQPKSATLGSMGAKEKRKLFRKSSSLDSTSVSASLGKVGMQMLPTAVPSGFSPSDLLAAVKRKFRPTMKKALPTKDDQTTTTSSSTTTTTTVPSIPISKSADNMADISGQVIRSPDAFRSMDISPALTPSSTSPDPFQFSQLPQGLPSLTRTDSHKAAVSRIPLFHQACRKFTIGNFMVIVVCRYKLERSKV